MIEQEMAEKNLILKFLSGSHAYGTSTPESDKDYLGVFIPDKRYVLGNSVCEQVEIRTNKSASGKKNTKEDIDTVIYSLPKFLKMLQANNPTILETLYYPKKNIMFCDDFGKKLLESRSLFPTKQVKNTFLGYAQSQKKHLTHKKERWTVLGKALEQLARWEVDGNSTLPDNLQLVSELREDKTWGMHMKGMPIDEVRGYIKKEIDSYGHRIYDIQKYGYSCKFASHLIRLLDEGLTFLVEGELQFPIPNNNLVRDVKMGKYDLEAVLKMAEDKEKLVELAYINTKLPTKCDSKKIEDFQIEMLESFWSLAR